MREFCGWLALLSLMVAGLCAAQDTNFPVGPQYLANYGSPLFLRPVATPSLSLSAPPATNPNAPAEEGTGEPASPAVGGFKSQAAINRIYWGAEPVGANPVEATPEESAGGTSTGGKSSEIELSAAGPSAPIPSSIADVGVWAASNAAMDSNMPLGQVAAYWKENPRHASRVFTNADTNRLHPN